MGRVIHFEITAADPDRTAGFYAKAFGWETTASPFAPGYLLAATGAGDGIDGAIMSRDHQAQPAILWIEVDDIDASVEVVTAAGGTTHGEINEIPGEGRVGYVRDPDGTLLGLRQPTQKSDRSQPADSPVGNLDDAGEDWLTWTSPTSAGPA